MNLMNITGLNLNQIKEDDVLRQLNYAFHTIFKSICYKSFLGVIRPKVVSSSRNHIKTQDPNILLTKSMMKQLEFKVTELETLDSLKITIDISRIAPLKGIKVEQGFVCKV